VLALVASSLALSKRQGTPYIWDLADGEDKGIGGGFDVVDDRRQPPWVFKYTYDRGTTVSIGNSKFLIPDGLSAPSVHQYIGFNESRLMNNWNDYYTYAVKTTSINAALTISNVSLTAAFSATKGYIKQLTNNGTKTFGFQGGVYLTFAIQFRGTQRPALDPDFDYDVQHLPQNYDPSAYNRFIKAWGTHYFTRATYGCMYNITAAFDNKFSEQKGSKWSSSQLDLTLKYNMFEFGVKNNKQVNASSIDGSFANDVKVQANARGGNELKFVMGHDYDAWLESCSTLKVPIPLYSDVEPLTYLVQNPTVKANLQKAIIAYGTTGNLNL